MTITVGIYEAKTRFPAIVSGIEATLEEVIVTRHGKPVARIVPILDAEAEREARLERLRSQHRNIIGPPLTDDEILEMIHEGRDL